MFRKINWFLIFAPIILSLFGVLSMYSSMGVSIATSQLMYIGLGLICLLVVAHFDIKIILNYSYILFLFMLIVTALTLVFGVTRNGATAWYEIGTATFQPSEILKITFILSLARYYSSRTYITLMHIFFSFLYYLLPVFLILFLQNDIGTSIVFAVIWIATIGVIYFSKFEKKRIFIAFILGAIAIITSFFFLEDSYKVGRLKVYPDHLFLNMKHHSELGYQVDQSLIAIGSSSFWGKGLSFGTQNQFGFLPEKHNDFIFASIVEEMGLSSVIIIFFCYILIMYQLYTVTRKSQNISADIIGAGVMSLLLYHIFQNIGMNIGLVPVTGISLPFISYGGSFTLASYILVGLIESLSIHYKK